MLETDNIYIYIYNTVKILMVLPPEYEILTFP